MLRCNLNNSIFTMNMRKFNWKTCILYCYKYCYKYCFKKGREKVKRKKKINKIEKIRIQIKFIVDQQVAASPFISCTHQAELSSVRLHSQPNHCCYTSSDLLEDTWRTTAFPVCIQFYCATIEPGFKCTFCLS